MSLLGKIAKCLEPNSDLPTDVRFLFEMEGGQGNIVKEVRAHRLILAIASDAFKREFYGSMKEAEGEDVIVKDASQPVFQAMVDFIYNKQTALRVYELDFLASLYYLAEKFDLQDLKQGILAAIPEHEVTNENVLGVAILAEDSILHPPLSEALYVAAASFLKSKFNGKLENVVDFCVENESTELHGLVLFKMLATMKNIPDPDLCENCKQTPCLNGKTLTAQNFMPGAKVAKVDPRDYRGSTRIDTLMKLDGPEKFTALLTDGFIELGYHLQYYMFNCF
eukprot:GFUD01040817.1.p1 GENE.GFUD01040817.1~~GFUD01040817.1.p1  ORF type:complete len:280 (-),score=44.44 GFUD01040817.1:15-854(-)